MRPKPSLVYPVTPQMALDYVFHHFVVEKNPLSFKARAGNRGGVQCTYQSATGGCAIGCLLPPLVGSRWEHLRLLHMLPDDEAERIGATKDRALHIRVLRVLSEYEEMRRNLAIARDKLARGPITLS